MELYCRPDIEIRHSLSRIGREPLKRSASLRGGASGILTLAGVGFLTRTTYRGGRQCQAGSLTQAVGSCESTEALKVSLRMVGNHSEGVKA